MFAQQILQPKLSRRRYVSVPYALQNSAVFKSSQNWEGVSDGSRTDNGSEFHRIGPETAKHLWLNLVVLERGSTRSPRTAERRWPRLMPRIYREHCVKMTEITFHFSSTFYRSNFLRRICRRGTKTIDWTLEAAELYSYRCRIRNFFCDFLC